MFMYPNGVFYNEPLSEFVVFEIPTFLLFTMVCCYCGCVVFALFMRRSKWSLISFIMDFH